MKEAGVPIPPLIKRVWLWLHDHSEKTYFEVAKALGDNANNVSSTLGILVKRGMVTAAKHKRRGSEGTVTRYTCIGHEYELLPLPKRAKHELPKTVQLAPQTAPKVTVTPLVVTHDNTPKPFDPVAFTDNLTLSQGRALYIYLKEMFA